MGSAIIVRLFISEVHKERWVYKKLQPYIYSTTYQPYTDYFFYAIIPHPKV